MFNERDDAMSDQEALQLKEGETVRLRRHIQDQGLGDVLRVEHQTALGQILVVVRLGDSGVMLALKPWQLYKADPPKPPPVDRSKQCTTSGETPEDVRRRQEEDGNKLHDSYIVLCDEERAKGFVRPYRDAYRHVECGAITTMSRAIAETYARDPKFYGSTYCAQCKAHFPVGEEGEFTWYEMDGTEGPKVGT